MKSKIQPITVRPKEGDDPQPVEIIEKAIVDLAAGMQRFNASRLKREAIVLLLHEASTVGKPAIRSILNCMDRLEDMYLKPRRAK